MPHSVLQGSVLQGSVCVCGRPHLEGHVAHAVHGGQAEVEQQDERAVARGLGGEALGSQGLVRLGPGGCGQAGSVGHTRGASAGHTCEPQAGAGRPLPVLERVASSERLFPLPPLPPWHACPHASLRAQEEQHARGCARQREWAVHTLTLQHKVWAGWSWNACMHARCGTACLAVAASPTLQQLPAGRVLPCGDGLDALRGGGGGHSHLGGEEATTRHTHTRSCGGMHKVPASAEASAGRPCHGAQHTSAPPHRAHADRIMRNGQGAAAAAAATNAHAVPAWMRMLMRMRGGRQAAHALAAYR